MRYISLAFVLFLVSSCVSPKKYYTEQGQRQAAETREEDLVNKLVKLNRTIGNKDQHITRLENDSLRLEAQLADVFRDKEALEQHLREMNTNAQSTNQQLSADLQNEREARREVQAILTEKLYVFDKRQEDVSALASYAKSQLNTIPGASVKTGVDRVRMVIPESALFAKATSTSVSAIGSSNLAPVAELLRRYPQLDVYVEGHTDGQSQIKASAKLAFTSDRAISVASTLTEDYDINANQLNPTAKADLSPIASNADASGREENRRVEIVLSFKTRDLIQAFENAGE